MSRPNLPWRYVGYAVMVVVFFLIQWRTMEQQKVQAALQARDIGELKALISVHPK